MSQKYPSLQTPFKLANHELSHRIVMAPMTRQRASSTGVINASAAEYYSERATEGGLLISEGIVVHPRGLGYPGSPGLWNDEQVEAWKPVTDAVKAKGGIFFAQLWHVGRVTVPSAIGGLRPLASSTTKLPGKHKLFGQKNGEEDYVESQAMTREDIKEVIEQFVIAAKNAIRAGFDGIEIHGGNGYLLDTFVHSHFNNRTDEHGGSIENRLRFSLQIVDAITSAIAKDRTAIRIATFMLPSPTLDDNRVETFIKYAEELESRGLAYISTVEIKADQWITKVVDPGKAINFDSRAWSTGHDGEDDDITREILKNAPLSLWTFRRILKTTPLIAARNFNAVTAEKAIYEGRADLIAIGRPFTSNPDLVRRLLKDIPLTMYDRPTFYTPGMEGYLGWKCAE